MAAIKIVPVEQEIDDKLKRLFHGEKSGFVRAGDAGYVMPKQYEEHANEYYNFKLRSDDVWLVTYPRTGTTVTQEMIWIISNNFDYESSAKDDLIHRFPFIEFHSLMHPEVISEARKLNASSAAAQSYLDYMTTPGYQVLESMDSPRHIKTHLPLSLLPPSLLDTCKVVYNARNPKDVVESYYHHNRLIKFHDFQGDFDDYYDLFENDLLLWSPYWEHVKEGWEKRNHENVYFLFYEDIVKDLNGTIRKMADFLGKAITDSQVERLAAHLEINNFRENVKFMNPLEGGLVNGNFKKFVRKGQTATNDMFSDELHRRSREWISRNQERIGIAFPV